MTRCSPRRPPATARWLPGSSRGCASTSSRAQSWPDSITHFAALCTKHGKVAGVLLGDHSAAPLYQSLGMKFIGIGSDLMVMMERAAAAVDKQRVNTSHDWTPGAPQLRRGQESLRCVLGLAPAARAVRGLDPDRRELRGDAGRASGPCRPDRLLPRGSGHPGCPQPGLAFPRRPRSPARPHHLRRPQGHADDRRGRSCSRRGLGRRARPQRRRGARRQGRMLVQGARARSISGPNSRTTSPRCRPPASSSSASRQSEIAEIIASADFVMASTANFFLAEGREQALASLVVAAGGVQEAGQAVSPSR